MRKIIIAIIVTIFLIAPLEKAKGQHLRLTIESADFPTANILTGVNAKISFGLSRFDLFLQAGQYVQWLEERLVSAHYNWDGLYWERNPWQPEHYLQRFASMTMLNGGIKFRITDKDRAILGFRAEFPDLQGFVLWHYYFGYARRENLSQRTNIELSILLNPRWPQVLRVNHEIQGVGAHVRYGLVAVSAGLNFEISNNFYLTTQLTYLRRYGVNWYGGVDGDGVSLWVMNDNILARILTRNLINFSIGIHYHIPIFGGQQQQAQQRPPRQRVAPHQRALPCPPGQMRHLRSWDRPSSVFNHPTRR